MPTAPRCPHCTNTDPTMLEALDTASFILLCKVCAKTFMNRASSRSSSAAPTAPHADGR